MQLRIFLRWAFGRSARTSAPEPAQNRPGVCAGPNSNYFSLQYTPPRRACTCKVRAAIPMRLRAAKRHTTRVFRGKNTASHCREKHLEFRAGLYCNYFSTKIDEKTLFYCAISTRSVIMYFTEGSVRNLPQKDTRRCPGIGCSGEREVRRGQNTL